jgi:hypothetical protein
MRGPMMIRRQKYEGLAIPPSQVGTVRDGMLLLHHPRRRWVWVWFFRFACTSYETHGIVFFLYIIGKEV